MVSEQDIWIELTDLVDHVKLINQLGLVLEKFCNVGK